MDGIVRSLGCCMTLVYSVLTFARFPCSLAMLCLVCVVTVLSSLVRACLSGNPVSKVKCSIYLLSKR